MNISTITPYKIQNSRAKSSPNISFGCNKMKPLAKLPDTTLLSEEEITDNILKLTKKIQFISKILGEKDKTAKPVVTKIGDTPVYIDMDKSQKGKIKIDLYSDTKGIIYRFSDELQGYIPVENPQEYTQSLNITINPKDKRMVSGHLDIVGCNMTFERNKKTGKRELTSNRSFYFVPNLYECESIQDMPRQHRNRDKSSNIITSAFFNLFSCLTKVKPEISLIQ